MTILQLTIDATGMASGAAIGESALRRIQAAAQQAARTADQVNASFSRFGETFAQRGSLILPQSLVDQLPKISNETNKAALAQDAFTRSNIGVAHGVIAVSERVRLLTADLRTMGGGMLDLQHVGFLAAGGLLDLSHIFKSLNHSAVEGETGLAKFFGVLKANPLFAVVAALGAVTLAMSLFGDATKEAATQQDELNKLLEQQQRIVAEQSFNQRIGVSATDDTQKRIDALRAAAVTIGRGGQDVEVKTLAEILGRGQNALQDQLGAAVRYVPQQGRFGQFVSPDVAQRTIENEAASLQRTQAARTAGPRFGPQAPDRAALDDYLKSLQQETELLRMSESEREKSVAVINAENIAKQAGIPIDEQVTASIREQIEMQQQLIQMRQLGTDVFQAIGAGLFNAVSGANSLRQALVGVLQQLAAIGQQRAIQFLGNIGGQLFAATTPQLRDPGFGGVGGLRVGEQGPIYQGPGA